MDGNYTTGTQSPIQATRSHDWKRELDKMDL